jgi:tetratricopeptide (TPR) repeat protein
MEAAMSDGSTNVLLVGEPGIGKSRLVDWAMEEWTARGGVTGRGVCVEFNEPIPYQALFDALDSVTSAKELVAFIASANANVDLCPSKPSPRMTQFDRGNSQALPYDMHRLFFWLKSKIGEACQRRPLMIVVEDLQWADSGTLDFLMYLASNPKKMRLTILMTSRPQLPRNLRTKIDGLRRKCTIVLKVGPLAKQDITQLVSHVVESKAASPELVSWLQDETEGNPLFVIETLRLLAQRRDVELPSREASDWTYERLVIPDGVRSVVDQRLAYLDAAELRVARVASVLGKKFDDELLATVAGISHNTLSRHVSGLLRAGIFERDEGGYRFAHDKIRAVCYESLTPFARRTRHSRAAAVLAQKTDVPLHSLAWHQTSAEQWTLAGVSWTVAGDSAKDIFAYEEALQAYQQALFCLVRDNGIGVRERMSKEFALLSKLEEILALLGRLKQQHLIHRRMEAVCQRVGSLQFSAALHVRKAWLAGHEADFVLALQLGRTAWALAKKGGDRALQVKALHVVGWQLTRLGRNRRALQMYELALRLGSGGPTPTRAAILSERAMAFARSGDLIAAEASMLEARKVRRELGSFDEGSTSLAVEVYVRLWRTSERETMAAVRRAAAYANRTGDVVLSALVHSQMLRLDTLGARLGDALRNLRIARILSRKVGYRRTLASCSNEIANGIGRVIGSYEWAWTCSENALALALALGTPLLTAVCLDSQAMILMELGQHDAALSKIGTALEIYNTNDGSLGPSQESLGRRGAIYLLRGDVDRAVRDLDEAAQAQRQSGYKVVLADTLAYLALAEAMTGDLIKARATSEEALRVLEEIEWTGYQPQRVFWHHYRILEMIGEESRDHYLRRAVDFVEAQASTLSAAQGRRLRSNVPLNRAILEAWGDVREKARHRPRAASVSVAG